MALSLLSQKKWRLPHVSGEDITLGGSKASFEPILNLDCFRGRSRLSLIPQITALTAEAKGDLLEAVNPNSSIKWAGTGIIPEFNERGGLDIIITLIKKPAKNYIDFGYDATGLVGYHQPELTAAEIAEGCFRPDHVVNSIAWYHNSKGVLVTKSDTDSLITTGKAGHTYRMMVRDALNNKTWANWTLESAGIARLWVDSTYLNKAVYPVVLAPVGDTFGYTTVGGSYTAWGGDYWRGIKATPSSSGTVDNIKLYTSTGLTSAHKAVLCNSSLSIVTNGTGTATDTKKISTWNTLSFSSAPSVTGSTAYWVGAVCETSNSSMNCFYDTESANSDKGRDTSNSYSSPTSPTDADTSRTTKFSIYCTYTPSSSPVTVTPTTLDLTITTYAPTVTTTANQIVTPTTLALTITSLATRVGVADIITPVDTGADALYLMGYDYIGIQLAFQRKLFYAATRVWLFYTNSSGDYKYVSSADGSTWGSSGTILDDAVEHASHFLSAWFDGTYFHICYYESDILFRYRRGLPSSDGTITWGAVQTICAESAGRVGIATDTDGYVYVVYTNMDTGRLYVTKSSTKDGTWTTADGYPIETTSASEMSGVGLSYPEPDTYWQSSIVPMASGKMYITFTIEIQLNYGKVLSSGSLGALETLTDDATSESATWSTASDGDTIYHTWSHEALVDGNPHRFISINTRSGGSWGTPVVIDEIDPDNDSSQSTPSVIVFENVPYVAYKTSALQYGWIKIAKLIAGTWVIYSITYDETAFGWEIISTPEGYLGQIGVAYTDDDGNIIYTGVQAGVYIQPTTLALTITAYAPTVTAIAPVLSTPTTLALTITTYAPDVTASAGDTYPYTASVIVESLVTATRTKFVYRSSNTLVGVKATALRALQRAFISATVVGAAVTATTAKVKERIASVLVGAVATATKFGQYARVSAAVVGLKATAIGLGAHILYTAEVIVGAIASASLGLRKIRNLALKAATSQYRQLKLLTSQYRAIKVITSMYRKITGRTTGV